MDLLEIRNNRVFPTVHALMLEPFKTIWESDTEEQKGNAIKVFSYIEFVCSPKKSNIFLGYEEKKRSARVKKEIYGDENYPTTDFMMRGVLRYKQALEESSPTYPLLISGLNAKDKLISFLDTFDLEERTNSGTAVLKPADITRALKEIPEVAKAIQAMREKVHSELEEAAKTRNQREVGDYER